MSEHKTSHPPLEHSIGRRFSFALIGVVTLTLFGFAVIIITINLSRANSDLALQLDNTLALVEKSLAEPVWNFDHNTVNRIAEALFLDESVMYVQIFDGTRVFSKKIRPPFEDKDISYFQENEQFIVKSSPIYRNERDVGTILLVLSRDKFKEALTLNILSIIALTILIIIAISLTSLFITRRYISHPLSELQLSAATIANGDLDVTIGIHSKDEIGSLAHDLNIMRDAIKRLFEALRNSNRKLEDANQMLEQRVEERTEELEKAMQTAQEARVVAEAANHSKSTFLANMSHELRTPLNAILGFSQLMDRDPELTAQQREWLKVIEHSGEHLLTLINDVLDMSKIEAGQTRLNEERFDLYRLLDGLREMFDLRAKDKGLALSIIRSSNVPRYVHTDAGKLRQVLINLLGNAIKFTQKGAVMLRVKGERLPDFEIKNPSKLVLHCAVEDTGLGIAPDEMNILFDAFSQTSAGQQSQEGTGLGLPISKEFVQLMGGEISVSSQMGKGSEFRFHIEVRSVDEIDIKTEGPGRRVVGLAPNQPAYRILVVEDQVESRMLMVNLLRSLSLDVQEAENGQEGIAVWQSWRPHLIWMDMHMPVMDGYEATRKIKETELGKETVVVAVTASAFEEDRQRIMEMGCDGFVRKPFREAEVFEMMTQHLGVAFVYEEEEVQDDVSSGALTPESLSTLSSEWVGQLHKAATQADMEVISELIDEITGDHSDVAKGLQELVDDFRFDKIMALTC